jgi:hypothetical protein
MTKAEFYSLKRGDVVLFPSGLIRSITQGPADKGGHAIQVPRFNRSQFHTLRVTKFFEDVPRGLKKIGRVHRLALRAEILRLKQLGFNIKKRAREEAREDLRCNRIFGRKVCPALLKLAR